MNKYITSGLVLIVVLLAGFIIFKLALRVGTAGENVQSEKPMVICSPHNAPADQQKCYWTAHIHVGVKIFNKGKEVPIGFEQGALEKGHTHAQKNKLHWHGLIPVDTKTKEFDTSAFRIDKIPGDLKVSLPGNPRFIVNGKQEEGSYLWHDGDEVEIYYE